MSSSKLQWSRGTAVFTLFLIASAGLAQDAPQVMRNPDVSIAYPEVSHPSMDVDVFLGKPPEQAHIPRRNPFIVSSPAGPDGALQAFPVAPNMPTPSLTAFIAQGFTNSVSTLGGDPPDTNGAVGPNHYVQTVNTGYAVFSKTGTTLQASRLIKSLWTGYIGTNAGNGCASDNDGDPIVVYDQLADRWLITQFSLPNFASNIAPSFQCVAVSQTGDPAGAYNLYDFQYNAVINDYGKFAVWPDAYYAGFNNFGPAGYLADVVCAYDRASMIAGVAATQQCFSRATDFGMLPVSVEGKVPPPRGEPGLFLEMGTNSLLVFKFHVDWTNPASSSLTGTSISVSAFTRLCGGGTCVPQAAPGNQLDSLGDRLMFRATYRNFGSFESVVASHSVSAAGSGGPRWYELRTPTATPTIAQQGTFAPDLSFRWMGSIAQDQAQDFALGYSLSNSTSNPAIAWTGRLPSDAAGTMGQGETTLLTGGGVETGTLSNGATATRWGDYTNMTVDPSDDCTFWYTNEVYHDNSVFHWDTAIAAVKFPRCAQNDFSLSVTPSTSSVAPSGTTPYTITTAATAGTAESIALNIQDLPSGVTGAFVPATVIAGTSSTLTLSATAGATLGGPVTFTVIGKTPSAVHANTATVTVATASTVPTNVVATAIDSTHIGVTWTAVSGATSYEIDHELAVGTGFTLAGTSATNSFSDAVSTGAAALYRVRAIVSGVASANSNVDLGTAILYTDDPLTAGTTFVKGVHLTELRAAVTAVATLAATLPVSLTDVPVTTSTPIKSIHVTELRSALDTARSHLGLPALTYANSAASNTLVRTTDITELRNGMK